MRALRGFRDRFAVAGLLAVWFAALASPHPAGAETLNLGFISYDVFIQGEENVPGVNALNIFNFTGDPLLGGFALEPDFPSYTSVTFLNSTLSVTVNGLEEVIVLGDIEPGLFDPGAFDPPPGLQFPETAVISFLMFSATLSTTTFVLEDGTTLFAASSLLSLSLLPSGESAFVPGLDFGLLSVEVTTEPSVPVPEPGTFMLLMLGIAGFLGRSAIEGYRCRRSADL